MFLVSNLVITCSVSSSLHFAAGLEVCEEEQQLELVKVDTVVYLLSSIL